MGQSVPQGRKRSSRADAASRRIHEHNVAIASTDDKIASRTLILNDPAARPHEKRDATSAIDKLQNKKKVHLHKISGDRLMLARYTDSPNSKRARVPALKTQVPAVRSMSPEYTRSPVGDGGAYVANESCVDSDAYDDRVSSTAAPKKKRVKADRVEMSDSLVDMILRERTNPDGNWDRQFRFNTANSQKHLWNSCGAAMRSILLDLPEEDFVDGDYLPTDMLVTTDVIRSKFDSVRGAFQKYTEACKNIDDESGKPADVKDAHKAQELQQTSKP